METIGLVKIFDLEIADVQDRNKYVVPSVSWW